jgi:hypothetical protein
MNKKSSRIVAFLLLAVFAGWVIMTVLPKNKTTKGGRRSLPEAGQIEPQFIKEGSLVLLDSAGLDTIKTIDIEIAEQADEIQYGMMYRKSMDPNTGMLFLMPNEGRQSFYMKNTYVSLDIIYINSDDRIVSIQKNAEPLNEKSLPSEGPANKVLEVVGGFSDQYGIGPGNKISWQRDQ